MNGWVSWWLVVIGPTTGFEPIRQNPTRFETLCHATIELLESFKPEVGQQLCLRKIDFYDVVSHWLPCVLSSLWAVQDLSPQHLSCKHVHSNTQLWDHCEFWIFLNFRPEMYLKKPTRQIFCIMQSVIWRRFQERCTTCTKDHLAFFISQFCHQR